MLTIRKFDEDFDIISTTGDSLKPNNELMNW